MGLHEVNNPQEIFNAAEAFYLNSIITQRELNRRVEANQLSFLLNIQAVIITNHALATELYFKCVSGIKTGSALGGHDLLILYNHLKKDVRVKIEEYYEIHFQLDSRLNRWRERNTVRDFSLKSTLEKAGAAFIKFRYIFEKNEDDLFDYATSPIMHALRQYIIGLMPNWEQLIKLNY